MRNNILIRLLVATALLILAIPVVASAQYYNRDRYDRADTTDVRDAAQLGLFVPSTDPIAEDVMRLDLSHLTPIEALNFLAKWQARLGERGQ